MFSNNTAVLLSNIFVSLVFVITIVLHLSGQPLVQGEDDYIDPISQDTFTFYLLRNGPTTEKPVIARKSRNGISLEFLEESFVFMRLEINKNK